MKENRVVGYAIVFIALVVLAIVLKNFQAVLRPLAIATLLLFLVTPLARVSKKNNIPVWFTFTGLFLGAIAVLGVINSYISIENLDLKNEIPRFQERIQQDSNIIVSLGSGLGFDPASVTPEKLKGLAAKGAAKLLQTARTIFSESLLVMILLMFLIQSYPVFFHTIEMKYGRSEVDILQKTFQKIEGDLITYFGTKIVMSLGTAIGSGIVLFLFKAQFIYLSMLIVFFLNFIPLIGSLTAVGILIILYGLTLGLYAKTAWLFMVLMAVQILFGSVLEPKITGSRLSISPILIMVSLYLWGWIWGVVGMLVSVPLTIFIMIILKHIGSMEKASTS